VQSQPAIRPAPADAATSRRALSAFFVSGLLLSFLGAILPAWGYHLRPHFVTVGNYFLAVNAGALIGLRLSRPMLVHRGTGTALVSGCAIAFIALLSLSFTAPPVSEWWRVPGLIGLGIGAGLLNTAIFHAISPAYKLNPAATVNLAGAFLGLGSFIAPLLIAGTFNLYPASTILFLVALIPGFFAMAFAKMKFTDEPIAAPDRSFGDVVHEFTLPSAVLLSLLLFFHFGNEWAIAGWLPLFLIQRLGLSPTTALVLLSMYWLSLLFGRIVGQTLLPRFSHWKMLISSSLAALFGCLVLTFTNNLFGATLGTLLVGAGFAPIYPLVVEKIGDRFPHYHPGFFNGIFSIALTGGMLAPATLGYAGEIFGIRVVMALPAIGTFIVVILVLVIWVEAKIREWMSAKAQHGGVS
jgi:FHS family glucose/mannose:H+ symporter-like MFS transporter